ncbi:MULTISPECIES: aldo/keto reductase [unclassified Polaromonas]|uniref:aldo/keto reductase n=1 Tax=unclassified Polaromonas TaxID=2638319 RepID=UPI000F0985FB|nr:MULTISPECIES: aldo/keto reductase [unclassified Polaromonas]AYQ27203.1 aldo/keto reductase [Polaromonas sp. SP1]QGJ17955.1 aldo/keto reductase [Polaromonas sp. Pch-P]
MKLALGGAQFGLAYGVSNLSGQVSREAARNIVGLARTGGVDTIDTAIAYGDSEACLGEVGVSGFKVVTKLPAITGDVDSVEAWVRGQIEASLKRLGVTRIHGVLLHRAEQLQGPRGQALAHALQALKQEGLVAKVGVSIYEPEQLASIMPVCAPDLVQAPLNLLDRRLETSGWLQRLHEAGVEVHTRSAFLQGLLLMPRAAIPARFARWNHLWDAWHDWLDAHAVTATFACLQYPLSLPQVGRVVVGVASAEEFKTLLHDCADAKVMAPLPLPDLACADADLINPSNWNRAGS